MCQEVHLRETARQRAQQRRRGLGRRVQERCLPLGGASRTVLLGLLPLASCAVFCVSGLLAPSVFFSFFCGGGVAPRTFAPTSTETGS